MRPPVDILIATATKPESAPFPNRDKVSGAGLSYFEADGRRIVVGVIGIGPVDSAANGAVLLSTLKPSLLVSVGVGGCLAGSGLAPGDLAVAVSETYVDLGVETAELPDPAKLAFDGRDDNNSVVQILEFSSALVETLVGCCERVRPGRVVSGPFLTSATVTSTKERAELLGKRYPGAVCESMEGYALASAAALAAVPFCEVRSISNPVGPRDREGWKVTEAIETACAATMEFIEEGIDSCFATRTGGGDA